jgi:SAM-dependent MidA family methyltransferase
MTVAAFMELALYHPELGYYARVARRSGRAGDFFTSVDVGPLFGELLERQLAEMHGILNPDPGIQNSFDLVEAGAGNGRLSADILHAARTRAPRFYESIRLHLIEVSAPARAAHAPTLGGHVNRLVWSDPALPRSFEGVVIANELLDALPVHQVVMREDGLREAYVVGPPAEGSQSGEARLTEGPVSTPALAAYLERLGVELQPGWRVEINLRAVEWIHDVARRLRRGFIVVIDYGHEARELYSPTHAAGTLTTFRQHQSAGPESPGVPAWLQSPGTRDITSHVDFTSLRAAAEAEGLQTLGFMDQTYFLLGLLPREFVDSSGEPQAIGNQQSAFNSLKTLILPGGLGSTHKVMIFGKGVGTPALRGCSYRMRVT